MQWILVDAIWWVCIYWGIESGNTALTPWVTWVDIDTPMIGQAFLFAVCQFRHMIVRSVMLADTLSVTISAVHIWVILV